jgi:hypothetical protein
MGRTDSTGGMAVSSVCTRLTNKSHKTFAYFPYTRRELSLPATVASNIAVLDSTACGTFPTPSLQYENVTTGGSQRLSFCSHISTQELLNQPQWHLRLYIANYLAYLRPFCGIRGRRKISDQLRVSVRWSLCSCPIHTQFYTQLQPIAAPALLRIRRDLGSNTSICTGKITPLPKHHDMTVRSRTQASIARAKHYLYLSILNDFLCGFPQYPRKISRRHPHLDHDCSSSHPFRFSYTATQ